MKDLTPERFRCLAGSCPGVWELPDGKLLVVAEILGPVGAEKLGLPATKVNWATEGVFRIDPALMANVQPQPLSNPTAPEPYEPIDPLYSKPDVIDVAQ